ncbi:MAG: glycosyltransferase family 2 protein [Caulobacterales bacterium]|nr:glycosyltransferase family 2 protein [Caulobacterales bacterium]
MAIDTDHAGEAPVDLSILMVNYNTREMTLECLRSLFAETYGSFEVILIDNDSRDGSADAVAAEFPQVRLVRSPDNLGFARATNIAAQMAKGGRFLLLNTDTVVLDGAIDRLLAFADARPDAQIWGGRTLWGDRTLNPTSCWRRMTPWSVTASAFGLTALFRDTMLFNPEGYGGWARDEEREVDIVTGCLFLTTRALWERLEGFDEAFWMYGEEVDLCHRARALGARPVITPDAVIVHYGGASPGHEPTKQARILASRVALINRHWAPFWRPYGVFMIGLRVFIRYAAHGLLRLATPNDGRRAAWRESREIWNARKAWWRGDFAAAGAR